MRFAVREGIKDPSSPCMSAVIVAVVVKQYQREISDKINILHKVKQTFQGPQVTKHVKVFRNDAPKDHSCVNRTFHGSTSILNRMTVIRQP